MTTPITNNLYDSQAPPQPVPIMVTKPGEIAQSNTNYPPPYTVDPNQAELLRQLTKRLEDQEKREKEKEIENLKKQLEEQKFNQLSAENRQILETQRLQMILANQKQSNININNNNNNNNNNVNAAIVSPPVVIAYSSRLVIPGGMFCLILLLNLCMPGVGSILAGILYGGTAPSGNRTGIVICHGVFQLITCIFIFGWIWAIIDTASYFDKGSCG